MRPCRSGFLEVLDGALEEAVGFELHGERGVCLRGAFHIAAAIPMRGTRAGIDGVRGEQPMQHDASRVVDHAVRPLEHEVVREPWRGVTHRESGASQALERVTQSQPAETRDAFQHL
jgi:hypothetical protein